MLSSTFNSERRLPDAPWLWVTGLSILILALTVAAFEWELGRLGYVANASDSDARWLHERARASQLGPRALILVGASRIQLGLDLEVLRKETGLEPVQLALDGSGGIPLLAGLARDPSIKGTILVDYYDNALAAEGGAADALERRYGRTTLLRKYLDHPSDTTEAWLADWLKSRLRVYADGANPWISLRLRLLPQVEGRQYLITRTDRSRSADYSQVQMPIFYHQRVALTLDEQIDVSAKDVELQLAKRISALSARDSTDFMAQSKILRGIVLTIESRGGKVVFVGMPSSGLVREIEKRRYPKELFWNRFIGQFEFNGIHAAYEPELDKFVCPDGSHLDVRDRAAFTKALSKGLAVRGVGIK